MNGLPRAPMPMAPTISGYQGANPSRALQSIRGSRGGGINTQANTIVDRPLQQPTLPPIAAAINEAGRNRVLSTTTPLAGAQQALNDPGFTLAGIPKPTAPVGLPVPAPRPPVAPVAPSPSVPVGVSGGGAAPPTINRPDFSAVPAGASTSAMAGSGVPLLATPSPAPTNFASGLSGASRPSSSTPTLINAADPDRALRFMRGY